MRKVLFAVAGLAVILLVVSSAQAISKGPGGRIYSAGRNVAGNAIILQSFTIDENWDNTSLFYTDHGEIRDVNPYGYKKNSGSSPEIQVGAGTGYGKIVVGASYDNDPASRFSSYETMDVLRVTPSDSGHSVEVLGSGKGAATGGTDWSHRLDKSTDRGQFAIPDPAGAFTGDAAGVVLESHIYRSNIFINKDAYGDGDITDNDADYSSQLYSSSIGYEQDFELVGSRLYCVSSWSYMESGTDGIFYYQKEADNSLTRNPFYYDRGGESGPKTGGPLDLEGTGLAVGEVDGHQAAWCITHDPDCGTWGTSLLTLFIDLNDDGDAMDNAAVTGTMDEYQWIYDGNSASGGSNNPSGTGWTDLELITNENGTMFLLIQDSTNLWARGRAMLVMELADNGEYVGGDDGVKLIYSQMTPYPGSVPTGWVMPGAGSWETEFDAVVPPEQIPGDSNGDGKVDGGDLAIWQQNYDPLGSGNNTFALGDWNGDGKIDGGDLALWQQNYDPIGPTGADGMGANIPEPATLLLIGTGLAGACGWYRRRRVK